MTYEFHPAAEQEFLEAALWYEGQVEGLGRRFVAAIFEAISVIVEDPARFQTLEDGLRVFRLSRWPYKIFYEFRQTESCVRILCLMHHKRRPGYWKDRLRR